MFFKKLNENVARSAVGRYFKLGGSGVVSQSRRVCCDTYLQPIPIYRPAVLSGIYDYLKSFYYLLLLTNGPYNE